MARQTDEELMREVEAALADLARQGPEPGADLMARIMADAEREAEAAEAAKAPRANGVRSGPKAPAHRGWLARLRAGWAALGAAVGGWPALTGLATATLVGLWLGYGGAGPLSEGLAGVLWSSQTGEVSYALDDFAPGADDLAMLIDGGGA